MTFKQERVVLTAFHSPSQMNVFRQSISHLWNIPYEEQEDEKTKKMLKFISLDIVGMCVIYEYE